MDTTGGVEETLIRLGAIAAALVAIAGLLALSWKAGRALVGLLRRLVHLADDLLGEPAHGDQLARPGLMERVGAIEAELRPNGGSSLRDAVDRVERRLDEHLDEHRRAADRREWRVNV